MKKIKYVFILLLLMLSFQSSIVCADGLAMITLRNVEAKPKIAVLMYHMISDTQKHRSTYCITPEELEEDIKYFKKNNYIFAFVNEIEDIRRSNPDKNIAVLTFDDGYESDYKYVLPLLKKYDVKATFFVFASMIGKPFYMTKSQLKELALSGYAEIGNHSYDLHNKNVEEIRTLYDSLDNIPDILNDFHKNKTILEKITGTSITSLSYPNGVYTSLADSILKKFKICNISVSTEEKQYNSYYGSEIIGRFNRSDMQTAETIVDMIKQKIHFQ